MEKRDGAKGAKRTSFHHCRIRRSSTRCWATRRRQIQRQKWRLILRIEATTTGMRRRLIRPTTQAALCFQGVGSDAASRLHKIKDLTPPDTRLDAENKERGKFERVTTRPVRRRHPSIIAAKERRAQQRTRQNEKAEELTLQSKASRKGILPQFPCRCGHIYKQNVSTRPRRRDATRRTHSAPSFPVLSQFQEADTRHEESPLWELESSPNMSLIQPRCERWFEEGERLRLKRGVRRAPEVNVARVAATTKKERGFEVRMTANLNLGGGC